MENGLYKVRFWLPQGSGHNVGTGIVLLDNGRFRGGDSITAFDGTYEARDGLFQAAIRVRRHSEGLATLSGLDRASWELSGTHEGGMAKLTARVLESPGIVMMLTLERFQV